MTMATVALTSENFDDVVLGGDVVLIDCWAKFCRGCHDFLPVFESAAERHSDHTFAQLDTAVETDLTEKLKVQHIPTLILFREGVLLLRQPGYVPADGIDEIIEKAAGLDMNEVRAHMAQEAAEASSRD
jgi:thioredoxin 1